MARREEVISRLAGLGDELLEEIKKNEVPKMKVPRED